MDSPLLSSNPKSPPPRLGLVFDSFFRDYADQVKTPSHNTDSSSASSTTFSLNNRNRSTNGGAAGATTFRGLHTTNPSPLAPLAPLAPAPFAPLAPLLAPLAPLGSSSLLSKTALNASGLRINTSVSGVDGVGGVQSNSLSTFNIPAAAATTTSTAITGTVAAGTLIAGTTIAGTAAATAGTTAVVAAAPAASSSGVGIASATPSSSRKRKRRRGTSSNPQAARRKKTGSEPTLGRPYANKARKLLRELFNLIKKIRVVLRRSKSCVSDSVFFFFV